MECAGTLWEALRSQQVHHLVSQSTFTLEVHGLCELSVLESRSGLLCHLGAPTPSLLLALGCILFKISC